MEVFGCDASTLQAATDEQLTQTSTNKGGAGGGAKRTPRQEFQTASRFLQPAGGRASELRKQTLV